MVYYPSVVDTGPRPRPTAVKTPASNASFRRADVPYQSPGNPFEAS